MKEPILYDGPLFISDDPNDIGFIKNGNFIKNLFFKPKLLFCGTVGCGAGMIVGGGGGGGGSGTGCGIGGRIGIIG